MSKENPYAGIQWENSPSTATPLSANNLNLVDAAIIDNETRIKDLEDYVDILNDTTITLNSITYNTPAENQITSTDWNKIKDRKIVLFSGWYFGATNVPLYVPFYPQLAKNLDITERKPLVIPVYVKNDSTTEGEGTGTMIWNTSICFYLQGNTLHWYKQTSEGLTSHTSENKFTVTKIYY